MAIVSGAYFAGQLELLLPLLHSSRKFPSLGVNTAYSEQSEQLHVAYSWQTSMLRSRVLRTMVFLPTPPTAPIRHTDPTRESRDNIESFDNLVPHTSPEKLIPSPSNHNSTPAQRSRRSSMKDAAVSQDSRAISEQRVSREMAKSPDSLHSRSVLFRQQNSGLLSTNFHDRKHSV